MAWGTSSTVVSVLSADRMSPGREKLAQAAANTFWAMLCVLAGDLGPGPEEIARLALGLGADVPFFLAPGPALVTGIGERVAPFPFERACLDAASDCGSLGLDHRAEQPRLVVEMMVERASGDIGRAHDLGRAGLGISFLGEERAGGGDQARAHLLRAGFVRSAERFLLHTCSLYVY